MIPNVQKAKKLMKKYVKKQEFINHNLEVGKALRELAIHYQEDFNYWEIIGILHDIDIELYGTDLNNHTIEAENILLKENIDQEIIDIIKTHNDATHLKRTSKLEHCLYSADGLSGLIHAYVLMRPDKDIQQAKVKSIMKKIKDKAFARGVNRKEITCVKETLNMEVKDFVEIVLNGMKMI